MKCLLYDVREMVKASSNCAVATVSSALSARPACSVAASTCGLSSIDVPKLRVQKFMTVIVLRSIRICLALALIVLIHHLCLVFRRVLCPTQFVVLRPAR